MYASSRQQLSIYHTDMFIIIEAECVMSRFVSYKAYVYLLKMTYLFQTFYKGYKRLIVFD